MVEKASKLVDIRSRSGYRPNVAALAREQIATARSILGCTPAEFAEALSGMVGWPVSGSTVMCWEEGTGAVPPGDALVAAGIISHHSPQGATIPSGHDMIDQLIADTLKFALLASVPPSFPAEVLQGAWITSYTFSSPPKRHVDVAHITADGDRMLRATNYPPQPRTEGHLVPFRNVIEGQLAGRHLVGRWRNDSDNRYFGTVQLAAMPGENVLAGHYTGYASDIEVSGSNWTWVRLDPASLDGVDLGRVTLRDPQDLAELLGTHSRPYSPPLPLSAIVEEH